MRATSLTCTYHAAVIWMERPFPLFPIVRTIFGQTNFFRFAHQLKLTHSCQRSLAYAISFMPKILCGQKEQTQNRLAYKVKQVKRTLKFMSLEPEENGINNKHTFSSILMLTFIERRKSVSVTGRSFFIVNISITFHATPVSINSLNDLTASAAHFFYIACCRRLTSELNQCLFILSLCSESIYIAISIRHNFFLHIT